MSAGRLSIGSDHGGFELKTDLLQRLRKEGFEVLDRGSPDQSPVDYPDIALDVAGDLLGGRADLGILICGTGIGMCNAASRIDGIVAALCTSEYMARMARLHNGANILCLGGRVVGAELAWEITKAFLFTAPSNDERYLRRRGKVAAIGRRG